MKIWRKLEKLKYLNVVFCYIFFPNKIFPVILTCRFLVIDIIAWSSSYNLNITKNDVEKFICRELHKSVNREMESTNNHYLSHHFDNIFSWLVRFSKSSSQCKGRGLDLKTGTFGDNVNQILSQTFSFLSKSLFSCRTTGKNFLDCNFWPPPPSQNGTKDLFIVKVSGPVWFGSPMSQTLGVGSYLPSLAESCQLLIDFHDTYRCKCTTGCPAKLYSLLFFELLGFQGVIFQQPF